MTATDPKDDFRKSLAAELVKAGKANTAITETGDAGRKKAMERLAEAFADPVGEFIDEKAAGTAAGVKSSDGTVDISTVTEGERTYADLSVRNAVDSAVAAEAQARQEADEEISASIVPQVNADWAEDDPSQKSFIENKIAAISDAEIEALED